MQSASGTASRRRQLDIRSLVRRLAANWADAQNGDRSKRLRWVATASKKACHRPPRDTRRISELVSGLTGTEVPRKGLRVRVPCPPLLNKRPVDRNILRGVFVWHRDVDHITWLFWPSMISAFSLTSALDVAAMMKAKLFEMHPPAPVVPTAHNTNSKL